MAVAVEVAVGVVAAGRGVIRSSTGSIRMVTVAGAQAAWSAARAGSTNRTRTCC